MMPFGVSSMMRLATVWMNSWSWLENRMFPLNDCNVLLNAWMDSTERGSGGALQHFYQSVPWCVAAPFAEFAAHCAAQIQCILYTPLHFV